jgi:hypothetical protein
VIIAEGVGIEFTDGCDAFWVLPGEVTSSRPLRAREPDVTALIGEFECVDRLRTSVLLAIRHDLAERKFYIDPRPSGDWGITTPFSPPPPAHRMGADDVEVVPRRLRLIEEGALARFGRSGQRA